MKKLLFGLVSFFLIALSVVRPVNADYGCQYGNCPPSQSILIDKLVGNVNANNNVDITTLNYVDNLGTADTRFHANDMVAFKLRVQNTSSVVLYSVNVTDTLPSYINPIQGPGSFDANSRIISFNAGDFQPGQEKDYYMKVQVVNASLLPADKGLFCLVNTAEASTNNVSDTDNAQFCVEKQVTGVTAVPTAGPEMGIVLMAGELTTLGVGFFLKKKIAG